MAIAEELVGEAAEPVVVASHQLGEGLRIARDDAVDELGIGRGTTDGPQCTRTEVPTSSAPDAHRWSIAELETRAQPCEAG